MEITSLKQKSEIHLCHRVGVCCSNQLLDKSCGKVIFIVKQDKINIISWYKHLHNRGHLLWNLFLELTRISLPPSRSQASENNNVLHFTAPCVPTTLHSIHTCHLCLLTLATAVPAVAHQLSTC